MRNAVLLAFRILFREKFRFSAAFVGSGTEKFVGLARCARACRVTRQCRRSTVPFSYNYMKLLEKERNKIRNASGTARSALGELCLKCRSPIKGEITEFIDRRGMTLCPPARARFSDWAQPIVAPTSKHGARCYVVSTVAMAEYLTAKLTEGCRF